MVDQTKSVIVHGRPGYQLYGNELLAACVASGTDYFDQRRAALDAGDDRQA